MKTKPELFARLGQLDGSKTIIVGIGNTLKGDDGAGPEVCHCIKDRINAEVIDIGTVPENYIQTIIGKTPKNLLVIDATDSGDAPGTINIFKPLHLSSLAFSTHTLSPVFFVNMIQKNIDVDVWFIGIQPAQTQFSQSLSEPVQKAVLQISDILTKTFPLSNSIDGQ